VLHTLASIDHFAIRDLHDRIAEVGMLMLSTIPAELANAESRAYEGALSRCRVVLAAIFGEPEERQSAFPVHVRPHSAGGAAAHAAATE